MKLPKINKSDVAVSTWRFTILAVSFIVLQNLNSVHGEGCLKCSDFNRVNVNQSDCVESYKNCGECIDGYIEASEDPETCFTLRILESSENKTMDKNTNNVNLICKFNTAVKCVWKHNGEVVVVDENSGYQWINKEKSGINTTDCGITLMEFQETHAGQWQCSNMGTSEMDSISSALTHITVPSRVTVHPNPTYTAVVGETVWVKCSFNQAGRCSWMRNGSPIKSKGNYQFAEDHDTKDCSLTIISFNKQIDQGKWICSRPGNSDFDAVAAEAATIQSVSTQNTPQLIPTIYHYDVNVSADYVDFLSGLRGNLRCEVESSEQLNMWWLLHHDREYLGQKMDDNVLNLNQELINAILSKLQSGQMVELFCMTQDSTNEVKSTVVNIIYDVEMTNTDLDGVYTILVVIIIVLVVFILLGLALFSYFICRKNKSYYPLNIQKDIEKEQLVGNK